MSRTGRKQLRTVRNPISLAEIKNLGPAYWWVVAVASVFTLARFSEAFLVLRAQNVGLPIMLVPAVLVAMNIVYAVAAYPAGVISDRIGRTAVLAGGILLLVAADIALALLPSIGGVALGVVLWGLHMGLTQGLLAALVADTAPAELRGTAYGFFNLLGGVAMLAASIIAGSALGHHRAAGNVPGRRRLRAGRAGGVAGGPWQDRQRTGHLSPAGLNSRRAHRPWPQRLTGAAARRAKCPCRRARNFAAWRQRVAFGFSCKRLNLRPFDR